MSQGFLDGYAGIRLTLPNGREVTGKVLPLKRAVYYINLWGKPESRDQLLLEFPKEVGLEAEMDELTVEECWEVVDAFFGRRVKPGDPLPTPPAPAPTGTGS